MSPDIDALAVTDTAAQVDAVGEETTTALAVAGFRYLPYRLADGSVDQIWRNGWIEISLHAGLLAVRRTGVVVLTALVDDPEQVGPLLRAIRALPAGGAQ